ncbi:hypothetical protein TNCV_3649181 [Trichonephila clavipes]|nr:hypothetical protein TNCV_3649181 [Trichonephila clavipes]
MKPITYCLAGHPSSCCQEQLSLQLRSILFRRAVNCIYRSSVDVVARGRPAPGRRLTFPVSWNRFHSLATTLLATPTASATLRCVYPDSSLPITRHAMGGFR